MDFMSLGERFNWDQLDGVCRANSGCRDAAPARRPGPHRRRTIARAVCRRATVGQAGGGGGVSRQVQGDRPGGPRREPALRRGRRGRTGERGSAILRSAGRTARDGVRSVRRVLLFCGGMLLFKSRGWRWRGNGSCICSPDFSWRGGFAFCAACRIVVGTSVAGARIPSGPRVFIFAGFSARGIALERAVSRAREPEGEIFPSTAYCP